MVKPPLRTKSIGFKVSEEEYAQLETAAQKSGQTLGEWCREAAVLGSANGEPQATTKDFDIEQLREEFERLAERLGGEYDGWGMRVLEDERERVQ